MIRRPFVFVVLDGYGWSDATDGNAVRAAKTPWLHSLWEKGRMARIFASGREVGLPRGVIGNSEVGHMNLGAGRLVPQDIVRIDEAIESGAFFENEVLLEAAERAKRDGGRLHVLGLVSDGCVHSSLEHAKAVVDFAARQGLTGDRLVIHVITDGRDTMPRSSVGYVEELLAKTKEAGAGVVATVSGRYFAMDRDRRWDRIEKAWRAIVLGEGPTADDAIAAIRQGWAADEKGDEFVPPTVVAPGGRKPPVPEDRDAVFTFNFRADRMRQIVRALTEEDFSGFDRPRFPRPFVATMMRYDAAFDLPVAFGKLDLSDVFAEVVSRAGLTQLHVAETEKYAHVTYFLNGGREEPFPNEERILVPSPKVATYDLAPEMSADGVTAAVVGSLKKGEHDVIVVNYANCDMVGHTGVWDAVLRGLAKVDEGLRSFVPDVVDRGGLVVVTADHGNAEQMIDEATGGPHTAHTTNPVPLWFLGKGLEPERFAEGRLADVIPTCLELIEVERPASMTGKSLIGR